MKVRFNQDTNTLFFGDSGKIKMQNGSLNKTKPNGALDTDIIAGLATYLEAMDHQHRSLYTETALESLHAAFLLLDLRREVSHAKAKQKSRGDKS